MSAQIPLFGQEIPDADPRFQGIRRRQLDDGAWIDVCEGWLKGHGQLFDVLLASTSWQHDRRQMFDREVQVPRLTAHFPQHGPGHPVLAEMVRLLSARYAQVLDQVSAACYRNGRDSVALHGDRVGRRRRDCVVAIVAVGEPRRFLLKPMAGGPSRVYLFGHGDLMVMGGSCQRTWLHGVPKVARAGARISIQFRPAP